MLETGHRFGENWDLPFGEGWRRNQWAWRPWEWTVGNDAGLGVVLVYVLFRYEILEVEGVSSFPVG